MWLGDFHTHSTYSDGKMSIAELVDFFGERGFGALAITDHLCEEKTMLGKAAAYLNKTLTPQNFSDYLLEIKQEGERALKDYGMLVIPGVELTKNSLRHHRSAHVLALGIQEYIAADLPVPNMIEEIKKQGGLSIAAHPISNSKIRGGGYSLWENRFRPDYQFDLWEVTDNGEILQDVMFSSLRKIANSDLHKASQISSWKTALQCEINQDSIFHALKQQKLSFRYYKEIQEQVA